MDDFLKEFSEERSSKEKLYTLQDLEQAHWHGWITRERMETGDIMNDKFEFPKEFWDFDIEGKEEWFFSEFKRKLVK